MPPARKALNCLLCALLLCSPRAQADDSTLPRDSAWLLAANQARHLRDAAKFRFEMDNDIAFGSDNQFSNGWGLRIFTARAHSWDTLDGPPAWSLEFGKHFPGLNGAHLQVRTGFAVGQIINTPSDIERTELIENDVPYVGLLAGQMSWMAFSDLDLRAVEMTLGTLGQASLGEQGQNLIHSWTGSDIARGWANQVNDEVVFNLNYVSKDKITGSQTSGRNWDLALSRGWALGTIFTHVEAGLDIRFGRNMPGGFASTPEIMGRSISHDATLPPPIRNKGSLYGSLSLSANYFFHHLLLDGSLLSTRHGKWVERYKLIGTANLGFHYERPEWALHLQWVNTTDTVRVDELPNNGDKMNRFLSLMLEWKIQ
ncbi:lipid A deacylase LpxR family protein [Granulosicoccaceae sp. 1_MG-2023]|nr:lipid A deacylase LpxR family protein [Granulosicoccaceae sp. 1_MG-2023]